MIKLDIDSSDFDKSVNNIMGNLKDKNPRIITAGLDILYAETQRLVPRKTGTLASTGTIRMDAIGDNTAGHVSYGEIDAFNPETNAYVSDYLFSVVEDPVDGNNFLEKAVLNKSEEVFELMSKAIGGIING